MTLIETIYQKSLNLTEQQSIEVIHFIDFIKNRFYPQQPTPTQREQALAHLDSIKINWYGKPIQNRDELYDDSRSKQHDFS